MTKRKMNKGNKRETHTKLNLPKYILGLPLIGVIRENEGNLFIIKNILKIIEILKNLYIFNY